MRIDTIKNLQDTLDSHKRQNTFEYDRSSSESSELRDLIKAKDSEIEGLVEKC